MLFVGLPFVAAADGKLTKIAAVPQPAVRATARITGGGIIKHAGELADADMQGRAAGTKGARRAAEYIAGEYRRLGIRPGGIAGTYFQTFKIRAGYQINSELICSDRGGKHRLASKQDYMPIHIPHNRSAAAGELVLVGYGVRSSHLRFDEYGGVDVKGRIALVFAGVPWGSEADVWLRRAEKIRHASLARKARTAAARGAVLLLVVDDPVGWKQRFGAKEELRLPDREFPVDSPIPVVHISRAGLARLTGKQDVRLQQLAQEIRTFRKPQSRLIRDVTVDYKASITGNATIGRNVIAILPGSDLRRRREGVVIGAHFDHLGERRQRTYFGANDNAAGVGALLAVAEAFRALPEAPARTVVFVAFGAEEIGKLGSTHYVARPVIPMARTVTMINFDMIGHNDPNGVNACATRSSSILHAIHQAANRHVGLKLTHPANFRIGRSDHTAFYFADVPVMYLFGGFHREYNTPEDTVDKLNANKLERVARLAFLTAYMVAAAKEAPKFDGEEPFISEPKGKK